MSTHLTEAELMALADGEPSAWRTEAREHLVVCSSCALAVAEARVEDEVDAALLRMLDHAPPIVDVAALIASPGRPESRRRVSAIAAGIGLLFAAGAAAAIVPGSPVHSYVASLLRRGSSAQMPPVSAPRPGSAPPVASRPMGVAFVAGTDVEVVLRAPQRVGEMRITLADAPLVRLTHRDGEAAYLLIPNGVLIENAGSHASYDLALPRNAVHARVRVGERTVFVRNGEHVQSSVAPDSAGVYVVPLIAKLTQRRRIQ